MQLCRETRLLFSITFCIRNEQSPTAHNNTHNLTLPLTVLKKGFTH